MSRLSCLKLRSLVQGAAIALSMGGLLLAPVASAQAPDQNAGVFEASELTLADRLDAEAEASYQKGDYARALPLYQRSLAIREKVLGTEHPDVASSLNNLAVLYESTGDYGRALPLTQRSLAILEKVLGTEEHPDVATSLGNLAGLYRSTGDYGRALPLYQRSLAIREKVLGTEHPDVASSLNNLAGLYRSTGDYARALPLYQRSLAIWEKVLGTEEHPDVASSLNNLAGLYRSTGDYARALPLYQRSLAIREKVLGTEEHPDVASSLNNLAGLYESTGDYGRALPLYQRSLAILERVLGPEHPHVATSLNNLAGLYYSTGDDAHALPLYQRSLAIWEKALGPEHPHVAISLNNLALLYNSTDDDARALPLYLRSLAILEKVLGPEHPDVATSLNNLAGLYESTGDDARALPLYQRSLAIFEKVLGPEHPDVASSLLNLWHLRFNDEAQAAQMLPAAYRAVVIASQSPAGRETLWSLQQQFSRYHARQGDRELAILWGKLAVNTLQSLRQGLVSAERKLQSRYLNERRFVYETLARLLEHDGRAEEADVVRQMLKEDELRESFERAAAVHPPSTLIAFTGFEQRAYAQVADLQQRALALASEREQLERKARLGDLSAAERQRIEALVNTELPRLRADLAQAVQALPGRLAEQRRAQGQTPDATVFESRLTQATKELARREPQAKAVGLRYVVEEDALGIALLLPDGQRVLRRVPVQRDVLDKLVRDARTLLADWGSDLPLVQASLAKLHALLIAPIQADLQAAGARTLMLSPNDKLRRIPFAALFDGQQYLVQRYTLTMFNEAVPTPVSQWRRGAWQVAGMGLTREVSKELGPLPKVREEVQGILQQRGIAGQHWLDDDFNRPRLLAALGGGFNILHVASHFQLIPGRPDISGLYLGDRSQLTMIDVVRSDLRFDNFDMVNLSACETGVGGGKQDHGQELESLGARVQVQGAQAVMATLWRVADESTAPFMQAFYRARGAEGLNKAEALRQTQMAFVDGAVRRSKGKAWQHPYYWAPFILMGNWR